MEHDELNRLMMDKLDKAGLGKNLVREKSALLGFPEEYYAEIVLDDAGKIPPAKRVLEEVSAQLKRENQKLDYIVRATWEVVRVEKAGMAPDLLNAIRQNKGTAALPGSGGVQRFIATLHSGARKCNIAVDMTGNAWGIALAEFGRGGLRDYGPSRDAALIGIVTEFVRLQLSYGGASYWDPILHPEITLNENALSYLMMHSPAKVG